MLVWVGVLCTFVAIVYAALQYSLQASERINCSIGLRRIGLALQEYHDLHGSFPPAWIADGDGNRMHSWRALILESWLETTFEIAQIEYHFDEPWDSPANRELLEDWPTGLPYRCPSATTDGRFTNYVMIVGDALLSDGNSTSSESDITDGPSQTIAVVEVLDSGIEWTEPRDLTIGELVWQLNTDPARSISSPHVGGAMVLMADGSTRFLENNVTPEELRAQLTIAADD